MMFRSLKFWFMITIWMSLLGATILLVLNREITHISIGGGRADTEMFDVAQAIAETYKERYPAVDIEVYETQGSAENARLLNKHEVDLAVILSDTVATDGVGVVARLFEDHYMLFVPRNSSIKSVADLRGKHVATPPTASGQDEAFWYLLEHYGIGKNDIDVRPMQGHAANFAMKQQQVDAIFRICALGAEVNWDLVRLVPVLRMIPIDQPAALAVFHPVLRKGRVPVGAFKGAPALPSTNIETVSEDTVLAAGITLAPDIVRKITSTLFERKSSLIAHSPFAGHIKPIDESVQLALPLHEGARRFYDREKPSLLQQNSRLVSTLLYIITIFGTAIVALKTRLNRQRRVHMQAFNLRLIGVTHDAESATSAAELIGPKQRLTEVMDEVIGELDSELVSSDEFARFSFTWRAAERVVDRRERELK